MSAARARGEGKTPIRSIRVEKELWDAFSSACAIGGEDRSSAIRALIAWYASLPEAELPNRPKVPRRPKRD